VGLKRSGRLVDPLPRYGAKFKNICVDSCILYSPSSSLCRNALLSTETTSA
jgi:hypothetical protein